MKQSIVTTCAHSCVSILSILIIPIILIFMFDPEKLGEKIYKVQVGIENSKSTHQEQMK